MSKSRWKAWTVTQHDVKGNPGPARMEIVVAKTARDAAVLFVRDHRPDLNGSAVAQNGSVVYGCDGWYYRIEKCT